MIEDPAGWHMPEYRWCVRGTWFNEGELDYKTHPCVLCKKPPVGCNECPEDSPWKDSHDPCVGHIDGIKGLCCGHGSPNYAYVAYNDGRDYRNQEAIEHLASVSPVTSNHLKG